MLPSKALIKRHTDTHTTLDIVCESINFPNFQAAFLTVIRDFSKVRKTQHQNPEFVPKKPGEIRKNTCKKVL
jgi:hypothetical protein